MSIDNAVELSRDQDVHKAHDTLSDEEAYEAKLRLELQYSLVADLIWSNPKALGEVLKDVAADMTDNQNSVLAGFSKDEATIGRLMKANTVIWLNTQDINILRQRLSI